MASPWFDDLSVQEEDDCDEDDDITETWNAPEYCIKFHPAIESVAYRDDRKEIGRIVEGGSSTTYGRLCKFSDEVVVCLCQREVPPEASRTWTNKLLGVVRAETVVILASFPAMRFLSEDSQLDSMPLLRCVTTTAWPRDSLPCSFLESPNTLLGCQAAALTRCELENVAAAAFLLVESRASVDLDGLQLLVHASHTPVLRPLIGKMANRPDSEVTIALRSILPPPSVYSSMFS